MVPYLSRHLGASEKTGFVWGESLLPSSSSSSSCPDAQISLLVPSREKTSYSALGARLPAHLLGRKEGQSFPQEILDNQLEDACSRGDRLLDLEGTSAPKGQAVRSRAPEWAAVEGRRTATAGQGPLATKCLRQAKLLIGCPPSEGW